MYSSLGGKHKADHNAFALDGRCERQNVVSLGAQRKKKVGSNHEDLKKKDRFRTYTVLVSGRLARPRLRKMFSIELIFFNVQVFVKSTMFCYSCTHLQPCFLLQF